jgi:ribosomal protein S18 acetylase RimI-like enzyme
VTIRAGDRADIAAVLGLWDRARSQVATTEDTEEVIARLLDRDPEALLVAESDGRVVGTLVAAYDGWRGYFHRLVVDPDVRGGGVGRALVEAGEERLRALGAPRVNALVGRRDERAHAFWEALGYPYDENVGRHFRDLPPDA